MRNENVLILFTKAPCICNVKTRMHTKLSHRECLYLHRNLTSHAINQFRDNNKFKLIVYSTQNNKSRYSYPFNVEFKKQVGLNLGARMNHAIKQELKNAQRVVLVGSDFLTLTVSYIDKAFEALSNSNCIVLGPTVDGGYGLIGMKKQHDYIFNNIPWGTESVYQKTVALAHCHGQNIHTLEEISDLDTIEDINLLKKKMTLPDWLNTLIE